MYINGEVVTTVTLLGAFSMPSLRLLFRHSRRGRGRGNQSYGTGMDGLGSDERAAEMRTMTKDGEIVGDRKRLYSVELQANV